MCSSLIYSKQFIRFPYRPSMMHFSQPGMTDILCLLGVASLGSYVVSRLIRGGGNVTTPLLGPPSSSWLLGASKTLADSEDKVRIYRQWATQYGHVYRVTSIFGSSQIILCDPKAVAHFYSKGTFTYVRPVADRLFIGAFVGLIEP